jgi:hypothetical protein
MPRRGPEATGEAAKRQARRALNSDVWPVVQEALADGWELVRQGKSKAPFALVKDGQKVALHSTPSDTIAQRNVTRQKLRLAQRKIDNP